MSRKSLGIDIGDTWITGVVIEQQRKSLTITTCLRVPFLENADVAQQIILLCRQIGWRQEDCVCGLPLSLFSVRNLSLPFRDTNKIAQALPFELEEQLIVPIDTLIVDFSLVETTDSGGRVVAFVAEKKFLSGLVAGLQGTVDPLCITPSIASLAVQVARHHRHRQDFLLVSTDFHSISLALIRDETPVFYRRLSYPEEMILHPPFLFVEDEVVIGDRQAVEQCVRLFCASIERSLNYYYLESGSKRRPDRVVLTGPLAEVESLAAMIAAALNLPVETPELLLVAGTDTPKDETLASWRSRRYDGAVSLAMLGLKRKYALNFRKDDFAIKRKVFSSRKQMVATGLVTALVAIVLLGFVWYDYRHLQYRDRELREEMTAIYRQTFPAVTTVHEPYIEMLAALRNIESSDSPTPLFAADKRVLALLADISARIPEAVDVRVSRLVIDRESVFIRGTTDTFNAVDTMKNSLAASPRYRSVQIVSATADMARNTSIIRFEIQLRLVEV